MSGHVFGHGCLTHFDSNPQQFPMNARSAPARVGEAHLTDQIANFQRYSRATMAMPTFPTPMEANPPAMPRDDGLRLDHEQR